MSLANHLRKLARLASLDSQPAKCYYEAYFCLFMLILDLNNLFAMDTEAIVIRIKTPSGDMDSSVDCPSLLNFNDLLVSLQNSTGPASCPSLFHFMLEVFTLKQLYSIMTYMQFEFDIFGF